MSNLHPNQETERFYHPQKIPNCHQLEQTNLVCGNRNQVSVVSSGDGGRGEGGLQNQVEMEGGVKVDCKEAQENFWVVALGLELLSAGYTWVYVFVKTDVYTQNGCILWDFHYMSIKLIEKNSTGISFKVLAIPSSPSYSSS